MEGQKPKLKELKNYVIPHMGPKWEDLGIELELDDDGQLLDDIKEERRGNEEKCCLDVVKKWLQGAGVDPKTWGKLLECLRVIDAPDAIKSIEKNILKDAGPGTSHSSETDESPLCTNVPTDPEQKPATQPLLQTNVPTDQEQKPATQPLLQTNVPTDQEQLQPLLQTNVPTDPEQKPVIQPLLQTNVPTDPEQKPATQPLLQTNVPTDQEQKPATQPLLQTNVPTDQEQKPVIQPLCQTNVPTDPEQKPTIQPFIQIDIPTDPEHQPVIQPPLRTNMITDPDQLPVFPEELREQPKPELYPRCLDYSFQLEPAHQVRNYQWELATPGIQGENYIICAPTGTGKTLVAALVISDHLQKRRGKGKVIFIVNTRPLAQQQKEALQKMIRGSRVECCVGEDFTTTIQILLLHKDIIVCTAGKFLDELRQDKVHFDEISLIVFDECHHTRKNAPYAEIMGNFHEEKQEGTQMPQVVGMTASPGAGTRLLELDKVIDHLVSLCALLDASGGIKRVTNNVGELNKYTNKSTFTLRILKRRDPSEPFIEQITAEMQRLEDTCLRDPLKCPFNKWSQEYETSIQQRKQPLELSTNPDKRDQISVLELLRLYYQVLSVYMDLRYEDAMSVLNEYTPTSEEQASCLEKETTRRLEELKGNISRLPYVPNPLLENVKGILQKHFSEKPGSKGIFFVRTKKHAHCITEWVARLPGIRPCVITGHSRESGPEGMTDVEKTQAIASFQDDTYNLLVATSVAEEGLDVPACNLVIRFQHVSNEIAKVQTRGRARAADSEGFTILSSDSRKAYQEIVNEELEKLVEEALQEYFPQGSVFLDKMKQRQEEIICERALKKDLRRETKTAEKSDHVQLKCKKCSVFACYGSDVYTVEGATHYVVPNEDFKATKINIKPHSKPKQVAPKMYKMHKIYCAQCGYDWGVMCKWPSDGYEFPLLKCKSFIFEVNGIPRQVGKWSGAPFEILPLSSQPKYQGID